MKNRNKCGNLCKLKECLSLKGILLLQGAVMLYTLAGVAGKFASMQTESVVKFVLLYGIEIAILAAYALIWQQLIKHFDLSIAYANRSVALLWSMLWAAVFFHENVSWKNISGVVIVIVGTIIVNGEMHE